MGEAHPGYIRDYRGSGVHDRIRAASGAEPVSDG